MRRQAFQDQAVAWLLAALLFRALIPAGFMLGSSADFVLTVQLCTGVGQHATEFRLSGDSGNPEPGQALEVVATCPFAASAVLAAAPELAACVGVVGVNAHAPCTATALDLPREPNLRPAPRAPPLNA